MTRIIGGARGGSRIAVPDGQGTRPTTDRVREALFSALVTWAGGHDAAPDRALADLAFLDLYAGSGAIGLEAASRGAAPVLAVERSRPVARLIGANARQVGLPVEVRVAAAEAVVAAPAPRPFDIAWLDPPYATPAEEVDALVAGLAANGWLAASALVVAERSSRGEPPRWPAAFADAWSRRYGETTLHFAQTGEQ